MTWRSWLISAPLTWLGVHSGCASMRSAATPDTIAADIDVPPTLKYWPSTTQLGHSVPNVLFGEYGATMCAPGATTSGFSMPSCVTPWLDQAVIRSSEVFLVPWSSTEPTLIAYGSLPGA